MENLTHTLVGLFLARCGLEKTTPRGAGMMMLAANIPDIDAVTWLGGSTTYLEYHRGITHALLFMPVMALLPMLLVRAKFRWQTWLASILGVLSHLLIDWTMSFGTPLLLPFSARRWRLDMNNLVDLWVWVILLGALGATALVTLVNREIGARNQLGARRGWAWAALILLVSFEGLRFFSHERALAVMKSRLYQGNPPQLVAALPGTFNPFQWRGVVEGQSSKGPFVLIVPVDVSPLDLARPYEPANGRVYDLIAPPAPLLDSVRRTRPFRVFEKFSQLPFWEVENAERGTRVSLLDLRFSDPGSLGFGSVAAVVDGAGIAHPR